VTPPSKRWERDALGSVPVPADALYGVHTVRATENFPFTGPVLGEEPELVAAFARIKSASAAANARLGVLPEQIASDIGKACEDMAAGRLNRHLRVRLLEGSGGTSMNMNVNEVVANRTLQIMGKAPGAYGIVHPNDHVNRSQSTNDVVPSAVAIAAVLLCREAGEALGALAGTLKSKARAFSDVLKLGRTCLQDAQPMTLGQAFSAYAALAARCAGTLEIASRPLLVLPLGATAIGTGYGAPKGYRDVLYPLLADRSGMAVTPADNLFDAMSNADGFARLAGEIGAVAGGLGKIADDLVLLSSGPAGGLGEIRLPEVQAGSSIMPGKVNPVVPMAVRQASHVVQGHVVTVQSACSDGLLEINHYEPATAMALLASLRLVRDSAGLLAERCIPGIQANAERAAAHLFASSALATGLAERSGYAEASALVRRAMDAGCSFLEQADAEGVLSREEADALARASAGLGARA